MLRFLNDINKATAIDIFINNSNIVSQLKYGNYSAPFDAKLGLYTIEVVTDNQTLLQINFQLRHNDTVIVITGNLPKVELRMLQQPDLLLP